MAIFMTSVSCKKEQQYESDIIGTITLQNQFQYPDNNYESSDGGTRQ